MPDTSYPRLLGDVGGTNARFGVQEAPGSPPSRVRAYPTDTPTFAEAVRRYVNDENLHGVRLGAVGIANPVAGDRVRMTNHTWSFSIKELREELGFEQLLVLNDFQALALSLPLLTDNDKQQVGGVAPEPGEPLALIGPGTGLGMSGLFRTPGGFDLAIDGEGGHATLPAGNDDEERVIAHLRARFGHVSAERALSGTGLEHLYEALREIEGLPLHMPDNEITARASAGSDPTSVRTVAMFCALLGSVAGNLALTLGARGGVYIGGGIVPKLGSLFVESDFRARFEDKGRMSDYLRPIPVYVIMADVSPALMGAARALETARRQAAMRV
jgi:glucokinase